MRSKEDLYPMNNTVDEIVKELTNDEKQQKSKKQKIKRSTIKQLRNETKDLIKKYK